MKKAILIDAVNREVKETTINTWQDIAPAIGCEWFEVVRLDDENDLHVDEKGLICGVPEHFIKWEDYPQPLAGSGLILGVDMESGKSRDTTLTVEQVKAKVKFLDLTQVKFGIY